MPRFLRMPVRWLSTGPAPSGTVAARRRIRKLCIELLRAAGSHSERRLAHRRGEPLPQIDLASAQLAVQLFDEGLAAGLPLQDGKTASLIVRACCIPHASWENLPRALQLMERRCQPARAEAELAAPLDQSRLVEEPRLVLPALLRRVRPPQAGTAAAEAELRGETGAESGLENDATSRPPAEQTCEAPDCGAHARWGRAALGHARACAAHRDPGEVRVDLTWDALAALADACVERSQARREPGSLLGNAFRIYALHGRAGWDLALSGGRARLPTASPSAAGGAALPAPAALSALGETSDSTEAGGASAPLWWRKAVTRLLVECRRRRSLPPQASALLPHLCEPESRRALNAYAEITPR
jgi:hypothetical protein